MMSLANPVRFARLSPAPFRLKVPARFCFPVLSDTCFLTFNTITEGIAFATNNHL